MGISFVEESKKMSDNDIIAELSESNYDNLQVLIDRYMPLIVKTAKSFGTSSIETEELIAEGIVSVFSAVKSFDETKSKFSTFVSLCIKRAMLDEIKSSSRAKRIPDCMLTPIDEAELYNNESAEEAYINKESFDTFKNDIVSDLSENELKVLSLYLDGNTYADISDKLCISLKAVDNALARVRKKIRNNRK